MANITTETITKIQFRRGTTADRLEAKLVPGEPGWDTSLETLYVGTGEKGGSLCIKFKPYFKMTSQGMEIDFSSTGPFPWEKFIEYLREFLVSNPDVPWIPPSPPQEGEPGGVLPGPGVVIDPVTGEISVPDATSNTAGLVRPGIGLEMCQLPGQTDRLDFKIGTGLIQNLQTGDIEVNLGPGLTPGNGGVITIDNSIQNGIFRLFVGGTFADDNPNEWDNRMRNITPPTPGNTTSTVPLPFETIMGAYSFALARLPRSCRLEIQVTENVNWNNINIVSTDIEYMLMRNVVNYNDRNFEAFAHLAIKSNLDENNLANQRTVTINIDRNSFIDPAGQIGSDQAQTDGTSHFLLPLWLAATGGGSISNIALDFNFIDNSLSTNNPAQVFGQLSALIRISEGGWGFNNVSIIVRPGDGNNSADPATNPYPINGIFELAHSGQLTHTRSFQIRASTFHTGGTNPVATDSLFSRTDEVNGADVTMYNAIYRTFGPFVPRTTWHAAGGTPSIDYQMIFPAGEGRTDDSTTSGLINTTVFGQVGVTGNYLEGQAIVNQVGINMAQVVTVDDLPVVP